jgi:hypothetical protein
MVDQVVVVEVVDGMVEVVVEHTQGNKDMQAVVVAVH